MLSNITPKSPTGAQLSGDLYLISWQLCIVYGYDPCSHVLDYEHGSFYVNLGCLVMAMFLGKSIPFGTLGREHLSTQ